MAEERAREYIDAISKEGLKTAFIYGNPRGTDVDLCIVSEKSEHLKAVPEGIDLKVLTPQEFEKKLAIFGKQAVEFRCLEGREYLSETIRKLNLQIPIR